MTASIHSIDDPQAGPIPGEQATPPQGKWVVLGMFGFAMVMILLLWTYWELYTRPFRPLQYAIAEAFPDSSPAVIGGRHKSHKAGQPNVLRVVIRVPDTDFNPEVDTAQCEVRAAQLYDLARQFLTLVDYDEFEVRLIQRVPEKEWLKWSVSRPIAEWETRQNIPAASEPHSG